jgi:hypothetical protein
MLSAAFTAAHPARPLAPTSTAMTIRAFLPDEVI